MTDLGNVEMTVMDVQISEWGWKWRWLGINVKRKRNVEDVWMEG